MDRSVAPWRIRKASGFTLLELVVVLALAAMASATVAAGGQAYLDRSRYHQAVRDVASQLGRARALSVQQGKAVSVTYAPQSRQLTVDDRLTVSVPESVQVKWRSLAQGKQDPGAEVQTLFVFNADGGARGGELIVARGAQGVLFRVNWLLGTIEQATAAAS